MNWHVYHYMSLSLVTVFDWKSILSAINIVTSALFWLSFAWNTFFHLFTCSLQMILNLKGLLWAAYSWILFFCFNHSATVSLLTGAFNSLTLKGLWIGEDLLLLSHWLFSISLTVLWPLFSSLAIFVFHWLFCIHMLGFLSLSCISYRYFLCGYHVVSLWLLENNSELYLSMLNSQKLNFSCTQTTLTFSPWHFVAGVTISFCTVHPLI